ncbi:MAG: hypothetical protein J6K45_04635 [Clostridia bacterium]|nr:hypothetical protein [Clostridia bacterium]
MDCLIDGMFLGIIIGVIIGVIIGLLIGLGISAGINKEDFRYTQEKLNNTETSLNEVITERDTYKNLILEKSLED